MKRLLLSLAVGLLASTDMAAAGWDFTDWGMRPGQVVAASHGKARQIAPGSISCVFKGTECQAVVPSYAVGPFHFQVRFGFDAQNRLNSVLLQTSMAEFHELERALMGTFGSPISAEGGYIPSRIWRDTANGNRVRLIGIASDAIVEYKPMISGF